MKTFQLKRVLMPRALLNSKPVVRQSMRMVNSRVESPKINASQVMFNQSRQFATVGQKQSEYAKKVMEQMVLEKEQSDQADQTSTDSSCCTSEEEELQEFLTTQERALLDKMLYEQDDKIAEYESKIYEYKKTIEDLNIKMECQMAVNASTVYRQRKQIENGEQLAIQNFDQKLVEFRDSLGLSPQKIDLDTTIESNDIITYESSLSKNIDTAQVMKPKVLDQPLAKPEVKIEINFRQKEESAKIEEMIGFIGSGNMSEALIGGLINKEVSSLDTICSSNPSTPRLEIMKEKFGTETFAGKGSNIEVVKKSKVVVLSVKPVYLMSVLEEIKDHITSEHLVISIVAGVNIDTIQKVIPQAKIARLAVNTPSLVGSGAGAYAMGEGTSQKDGLIVKKFMEAVGITFELAERLMDSVTGLAGSGPAFVFMFIEGLADGGVKQGIPRPIALKLAAQTVMGASQMVIETGLHPGQLKDNVASPGGTTIEGIHTLEKLGFRNAAVSAVESAVEKSRSLGKQ